MTDVTTQAPVKPALGRFLKAHVRDYALLISLDLSIYIVIAMFGSFVAGTMWLVRMRHLYNLKQGPLPEIPAGASH